MVEHFIASYKAALTIPEMYIPAFIVAAALFLIYVALNPEQFTSSFRRIKEELEAETKTRDALFAVSGAPKNMDFKLHRLGCPITYRQFQIINLLIGIVLAVISIKVLYNPKLALTSIVIWWIFIHKVIDLRYKKFKAKMDKQIELCLQLLSETYSLTKNIIDALVLILPSTNSPIKEEIELVVKEARLGKDPNQCLKELADRCDNRDMEMFVQGIVLSTHYGTDSTLVINETSEIIRERIKLKEELENELKGKGFVITIFLVALPLLLTGLLVKSPEAREAFLHTSRGQNMICAILILEFIAWYFSRGKGVAEKL